MMFFRLTLLATMTALPAVAQAQDSAMPTEGKPISRIELGNKIDSEYAAFDANQDGKLTTAEIETRLVKNAEAKIELIRKERDEAFAKLDSDGNGSISKAEFEAKAKLPTVKQPDIKPFTDRFDANKDGSITKEEFRAPTLASFERVDQNKDGNLTEAELKAAQGAANAKPKQSNPIGR